MESPPVSDKSFSSGNRHYLLEDCKWINRYSNKKKNAFFPSKRYMHGTVIHNSFMYLFGGSEKHKNIESGKVTVGETQDCLYRLDFNSWEWERIGRPTQPAARDSFGMAQLPHGFVIFGGSDNQTCFNDLWLFTYETETWSELPQYNRIAGRDVCSLVTLNSDTLLLYGGVNTNTEKNFSDLYVYSLSKGDWTQLAVAEPIENRQFATISFCGGRLYLFGGYGITADERYYNDLYRIDVNLKEKSANFVLVQAQNKPPVRSSHGMVQLSDRHLLVIGGEGERDESEERQQEDVSTKNDVWVFNLDSGQWLQLFPKNANFRPRLGFSISRQGNNVYLFGGMRSYANLYDQLMILIFSEDKNRHKEEICSNCYKKLSEVTEEAEKIRVEKQRPKDLELPIEPTPSMSNSFVSHIACLQQFAFGAIGMIVDCAVLMKADFIRICLKKKGAELLYLEIQFSGVPLTNQEFVDIIGEHHHLPARLREFSDGFKLGGYRLGRTFVYVCRDKKLLKVVLYSINSCIVPGCETHNRYFAYIYNTESKIFLSKDGADHRRSIFNFLNTQVDDPDYLLENGPTSSLLIFETKMIVSSKNIFYELIPKSDKDIQVIINQKKIHFLEELGIKVSQQPDVSLASYLSILYLHPSIRIFLNQSTEPLRPFDYRAYLEQLAEKKELIHHPLEDECINEIKSMDLYTINENTPDHNLGVLIYHSGRLLMRYKTPFSRLFSDKFFRNKYKKRKLTLFKELGVVELNCEFIKPNLIKTDLQNNQYNCELWQKLRLFIKELPVVPIVNIDTPEENLKRRKVE